jgi:hypothetical protein
VHPALTSTPAWILPVTMIEFVSEHTWEIVAGLVTFFLGCVAAAPLARLADGRSRRRRQR